MSSFFDFLKSLFSYDYKKNAISNPYPYLYDSKYGTKSTSTFSTKVNPTGTSMLIVGHSGNIGAGSWNEIIAKKYNMKRTNLAVGGKQTDTDLQVVKKFFSNPSVKSPEVVFIYSGLNDIWSGKKIDNVAANQQAVIDLVRARGAKRVYFILGYDGFKVNKGINVSGFARGTTQADIEKYKGWFADYQKNIGGKLKNVIIVPVETTITRADSYDGLHLNSSGMKKFANHVDNSIFSSTGTKI